MKKPLTHSSAVSYNLWTASNILSQSVQQIEQAFTRSKFKEPLLEINLKDAILFCYCERPAYTCTCCYLLLDSQEKTSLYRRYLDRYFPYYPRLFDSFWVDVENLTYVCNTEYGATSSIFVFKKLVPKQTKKNNSK